MTKLPTTEERRLEDLKARIVGDFVRIIHESSDECLDRLLTDLTSLNTERQNVYRSVLGSTILQPVIFAAVEEFNRRNPSPPKAA